MAISFVGAALSNPAGTSTSITATLPSGIAVGDLMVLSVAENKAPIVVTDPGDNWILLDGPTVETAATQVIYYKIATVTGGGTAPTVTSDTTGNWRADVAVYRGTDTTTPFIAHGAQVEPGGSATTVHSAPTLTNTVSGAWGLFAAAFRQVATPTSWTPGAGLTERLDADTGVAGTANLAQCWDDSNGTVAVGNVTYSATSSSGSAQAMMWAGLIQPPAVQNYTPNPADAEGITDATSVVQTQFLAPPTGSIGITDAVTVTGADYQQNPAGSIGVTDAVTPVMQRAVAFGSAGTFLTYASHTNTALAVPSGVAANDVILAYVYVDGSNPTISPPTGFTELAFAPAPSTASPQMMVHVYWKRATGADTGTYTFTHVAASTQGIALRFTGAITTGTPVEVLGSAANATSAATTPAVTGTTSQPSEMLVWVSAVFNSSTWSTLPSGFTAAANTNGQLNAYKTQATQGSTGALTATAGTANAEVVALVGLLAGTAYAQTPADPEAIGDAASVVQAQFPAPADPEPVSDAAAAVQAQNLAPADPVGLTDAVAADQQTPAAAGPDPVGITDAVLSVRGPVANPADPEGITDAATVGQAGSRTPGPDPVGLTDTATAVRSVSPVTNPVGLTDAVTVKQTLARAPADPVGITHTFTATGSLTNVIATTALADIEAPAVGLADVKRLKANASVTVDALPAPDLVKGPQRASVDIDAATSELTHVVALSGSASVDTDFAAPRLRVVAQMSDVLARAPINEATPLRRTAEPEPAPKKRFTRVFQVLR